MKTMRRRRRVDEDEKDEEDENKEKKDEENPPINQQLQHISTLRMIKDDMDKNKASSIS